jgi:hypothetical protein
MLTKLGFERDSTIPCLLRRLFSGIDKSLTTHLLLAQIMKGGMQCYKIFIVFVNLFLDLMSKLVILGRLLFEIL